jgi:OmpA-OmpF porin, OOP family
MWNWKSWIWPGVVTVAALTAGAIWFETGRIEADLTARAAQSLSAIEPWAEVTAQGRDVIVTGDAPSEEARQNVVAVLSGTDGVRAVIDHTGLLPLESPYRFSVVKSDAGLVLSGFAPSAAGRDALLATIGKALPGVAVTGEVALARGAPDDFERLVELGTRQLSRLGEGGFAIDDDHLSIFGAALSPEDYDALMGDVQTAEGEVSIAEVSLPRAADAFLFRAERINGEIRVSGYATSAEERQRLMEIAGDRAGGSLRLATGAPEGVEWGVAAAKAIEAASLLASGSAEVAGRRLDISGDARDLDAFRSLQQLIGEPLPGGLVLGMTDIGLPRPANDGSSP